ncbi:MAG: hypothetical protein C5B50_19405 [Verrucomicrobia bacterium]|nr:MAG: hypothetical protein C5B50_19405 [Verrucomicrobiota bacterium]
MVLAGVLAGFGFFMKPSRATQYPAAAEDPVAQPEDHGGTEAQRETVNKKLDITHRKAGTATVATARPVSGKAVADGAIAPASTAMEAERVRQAVDVLVWPNYTYEQKRAAWKQLREEGGMDQAIADLEQRATNEPGNADVFAILGHAYLQKCGTLQDVRDKGILAMQADKMFEKALDLDPQNWEARFTKAVAMSYWPPVLNKSGEVIQQFETLVQQQEGKAQQPKFAQTYAWLGDQYAKAGRSQDATATWERGAALFPTDEKLRGKLATGNGAAK